MRLVDKKRWISFSALGAVLVWLISASVSVADSGLPESPNLVLIPLSTEEISYLSMRETSRLRQDGGSEQQIEWTIQNNNLFFGVSQNTVAFTTPTAAYSNVRAWDDQGPLDYTLVLNSDNQIVITIHFRQSVLPGATYHYFLAIDLADVASFDGENWSYSWTTIFPVQEFVRVVDCWTV